jgi:hypothetical protein
MTVRDESVTGVGIGADTRVDLTVTPVPLVEPTDRFHGKRTTNE